MSAAKVQNKQWMAQMIDPPKLTSNQWNVAGVLGVLFIVMAVLQVVSFTEFKDLLQGMGLSGPSAWAIGLIIAELWAAAGFFKLRLSWAFRMVSSLLAILVAGFWFVETLQIFGTGIESSLTNNGFFGKFIKQTPGWWTVIEASIVLFWTIYTLELTKGGLKNSSTSKKR